MNDTVLELQEVTRNYVQGHETLNVLRGIDLTLKRGEIVALIGASGSGKSTLLQIAGLLDRPTSGTIHIAGKNASQSNDAERTALRLKHLGFIYQFHHLLPEFSALENIAIPQMIAGITHRKAMQKANALLTSLGLEKRGQHRPSELSGGEQQRVAIARAVANNPLVILADEPTGNLDSHTAETVFQLFTHLAKSQGLSAIVATHNRELAQKMDRIVVLNNGTI